MTTTLTPIELWDNTNLTPWERFAPSAFPPFPPKGRFLRTFKGGTLFQPYFDSQARLCVPEVPPHDKLYYSAGIIAPRPMVIAVRLAVRQAHKPTKKVLWDQLTSSQFQTVRISDSALFVYRRYRSGWKQVILWHPDITQLIREHSVIWALQQ